MTDQTLVEAAADAIRVLLRPATARVGKFDTYDGLRVGAGEVWSADYFVVNGAWWWRELPVPEIDFDPPVRPVGIPLDRSSLVTEVAGSIATIALPVLVPPDEDDPLRDIKAVTSATLDPLEALTWWNVSYGFLFNLVKRTAAPRDPAGSAARQYLSELGFDDYLRACAIT